MIYDYEVFIKGDFGFVLWGWGFDVCDEWDVDLVGLFGGVVVFVSGGCVVGSIIWCFVVVGWVGVVWVL